MLLRQAAIDCPAIAIGTAILLRRITFSVAVLSYLTTDYELIQCMLSCSPSIIFSCCQSVEIEKNCVF